MQHLMRILNPTEGDEHLQWDPDDEKSVKAARRRFEALVQGKGATGDPHLHRAYRVEWNPRKGEPITEFDPEAAEILIAPPMVGG